MIIKIKTTMILTITMKENTIMGLEITKIMIDYKSFPSIIQEMTQKQP